MALEPNRQEDAPAIWGTTATLVWGFVIFSVFVLIQTFVMGVYIGVIHGEITETEANNYMASLQYNGTVVALCTLIGGVIGVILTAGIIKLKKHAKLSQYLALNTFTISDVKVWLTATLCLAVAASLVSLLIDNQVAMNFMREVYTSAEPRWLLWAAVVIAAPLFEEVFFRGFLLTGLSKSQLGPIVAIIVTSACWAAIHLQYDLFNMTVIFLFGILLGTARLKTNSVLLTIFLHAAYNFSAMLELVYILD